VIAIVVVAALLTGAIGAMGAKSPSAARWNHRPAAQPLAAGAAAEGRIEAKIPPSLVWQTIQVKEVFGDKLAVIDVGPGGDSVGDYVVFRDQLRNPNNNHVVGTIDVTCMSGFADMCRGTARFTGRGQITFDGMTPLNHDPDHYPIVGGSGEFADVGGVFMVEFPANDYAALTFTLTH
jgi:hypothetical protein